VLYCQCDQTGKRHRRQKSAVLQGYSAGFHLLEFSNHCLLQRVPLVGRTVELLMRL
jgi:hypothetical protein